MAQYEVRETCDDSGATYCGGSVLYDEVDELRLAVHIAEGRTLTGHGGYVRRTSDGGVLSPSGWVDRLGVVIR